jgi:hypothetical protein
VSFATPPSNCVSRDASQPTTRGIGAHTAAPRGDGRFTSHAAAGRVRSMLAAACSSRPFDDLSAAKRRVAALAQSLPFAGISQIAQRD